MRIALTAVYKPVENGWTLARIEELPAVITAGPTPEEAKALLLDALREYLLSLTDDGVSTPCGGKIEARAPRPHRRGLISRLDDQTPAMVEGHLVVVDHPGPQEVLLTQDGDGRRHR